MKISELLKERKDLVSQCEGCNHADIKINKCTAYINPSFWWIADRYCPLSTNNKPVQEKIVEKKMNPLKASKRAKKRANK
jgi:hypothetical protein